MKKMPPARQRRRNRTPVIARIPGQSGQIKVEGSRYNIEREPDEFVVHHGGETRRVNLQGGEHHIHIHTEGRQGEREPVPRPAAERPFFNFAEMESALNESVKYTISRFGLNLDQVATPELKSRWPGVGKNLAGPVGGILENKWYLMHPLKFLGALFLSDNAGIKRRKEGNDYLVSLTGKRGKFGFRMGKSQYGFAMELRQQYRPQVEAAKRLLEQETRVALESLRNDVASNQVTRENRELRFRKFNTDVENAIAGFQKSQHNITAEFEHAWRQKGRKGFMRKYQMENIKKSG